MQRKELLEFAKRKVEKLFQDFPVPAHGIDHVRRVTEWAVQIAKKEGQDEFLAELAAILHDVGRVPERKIAGEEEILMHQELSYLLAKEWFEKEKEFDVLTSREKEEILYAARYHWDDEAEKFRLANILRDADKLDLLGEIGVKRAIEFYKKPRLIKKKYKRESCQSGAR